MVTKRTGTGTWALSSTFCFVLSRKPLIHYFPWLLGLLGIHDVPSRIWERIRHIMTFTSKNNWWCNLTSVWKKSTVTGAFRAVFSPSLQISAGMQLLVFYGWYQTQSLIYRWDASWMFKVGDSWHHTTCVALHELFTAGEIKADLCQWHKQQTRKAVLHNKTMYNNFVLSSPAKKLSNDLK